MIHSNGIWRAQQSHTIHLNRMHHSHHSLATMIAYRVFPSVSLLTNERKLEMTKLNIVTRRRQTSFVWPNPQAESLFTFADDYSRCGVIPRHIRNFTLPYRMIVWDKVVEYCFSGMANQMIAFAECEVELERVSARFCIADSLLSLDKAIGDYFLTSLPPIEALQIAAGESPYFFTYAK